MARLADAELDAQQLEAGVRGADARSAASASIGRLYQDAGYTAEAAHWLLRALSLAPDDAAVQLLLARAFERLGRPLEAAELYQTALRDLPPEAEVGGGGENTDQARLSLAQIMAGAVGDQRLALVYLRQIGSRSTIAVEARTLEAALALQINDTASRRSAWLRLLESVELGWVSALDVAPLLRRIEAQERELGQADIAEFAGKLLRHISKENASSFSE